MSEKMYREMSALKQELIYLKEVIADTVTKTQASEAAYEVAKVDNDKKMAALSKVLVKQQKQLDAMDDADADLTQKLIAVNDIISRWKLEAQEESEELQRLKNENAEDIFNIEKTMKDLSDDIARTEWELSRDEEYMDSLEKKFEETKMSRAKEYEEKLQKLREIHADKMAVAENKYNAKLEPLMFRIKNLDAMIEELEAEISTKPIEEAKLKKTYERLQKKLERIARMK